MINHQVFWNSQLIEKICFTALFLMTLVTVFYKDAILGANVLNEIYAEFFSHCKK